VGLATLTIETFLRLTFLRQTEMSDNYKELSGHFLEKAVKSLSCI